VRGKPNKLGEGERKVRLGQDRLAIKNGNERKLYTLFYPHPKTCTRIHRRIRYTRMTYHDITQNDTPELDKD